MSDEKTSKAGTDSEYGDSDIDELDEFDSEPEQIAAIAKRKLKKADGPTFAEAMSSPEKDDWKRAVDAEYESLKQHGVFSEPCDSPDGCKTLDTKIMLKTKEPEGSELNGRKKARLCVRGFRQEHGLDYDFTFAPVVAYNSLRPFVTTMATLDYEMDTVDVITAFLLSPIKEAIYIKIPDGHPCKEKGKVFRLLKCLYGLKQAPMEWNAEMNKHLNSLGFFLDFHSPT